MATLVAKFAGLVELTVGVVMSSPPTPPPPVPSLPPHPAMSIASGTAINHIICLLNNFCMWVFSYALHTEYCQCKLGRKIVGFPPTDEGVSMFVIRPHGTNYLPGQIWSRVNVRLD